LATVLDLKRFALLKLAYLQRVWPSVLKGIGRNMSAFVVSIMTPLWRPGAVGGPVAMHSAVILDLYRNHNQASFLSRIREGENSEKHSSKHHKQWGT